MTSKPVWFITGCSTGFGRELARHTLELGYPTVITARNPAQIEDLARGNEDKALVLKLDVTNADDIAAAVKAAEARFGRIDVLVNNAGIGYFGSLEESDIDEVRQMFEINVWGLVNMTRAVLPVMRKQRSGTVVNISSIGGLVANSAVSFYNATKFGVEAISEALSKEVAHLGIKVLIVEPSGFRTDWAGRSANEAPTTIEDYRETSDQRMQQIRTSSGNQPGDPVRAVKAIVQAVEAEKPPLRLLLGKFALAGARNKIAELQRDFDAWAEVTEGADAPKGS
ncbi:oxidoreductase [Phyllobacterium sp. 22229]|uniref:Short-chain dehydrogenase/reductase n=1 Tax=Phyllobacterium myrsinacearum TaxID=28101 RepID=A0A2S9JCR8_9HYPH|nr:oxidoreductase [Phyllobacterium myrsinacearum]PRD50620.1 short-chain dehydrogenase/reductase [Phyllobacterium myrsinacearum]PWV95046.1 NADP-dependent 3-hydroxy acid dehydrogenase YdfG [Phyllobacterium myrsinacearum]RZV06842.1 NADP-dependent 3-hydroxy acid dehydrogenase YdfG [Phyllobacterium myrsinacearum]